MKIIDRKFLNVNTRSCHAATMAFFQDKPVFSWFGGIKEGATDSTIYVQYGDKIAKWQITSTIPMWNPILFAHKKKLFLFAKSGIFCDRWTTFIMDISGIWNEGFDMQRCPVQILPAGLNGPVKTKIVVKNNVIYCGSSVETGYDWTSYIEQYIMNDDLSGFVFANRSRPLIVPKVQYADSFGAKKMTCGIIQPSLWINKQGQINAFFRSSRGLGKVYHSFLRSPVKQGWSSPQPTRFDNPNSGIDTVYIKGRLFFVHNPSSDYRYPLVISELKEDATFETISAITVTDKIPDADKNKMNTPELSYPYMIEHKGQLNLVYTYGRSKIEHVVIEV